ncbi:unnamed protein product [Victoria cruziana]
MGAKLSKDLFPYCCHCINQQVSLSAFSSTPLVILAGLGLLELGFPRVAKCIEIGLPTLIILIICYSLDLCSPAYSWWDLQACTPQDIHCRTGRAGLVGAAPWERCGRA